MPLYAKCSEIKKNPLKWLLFLLYRRKFGLEGMLEQISNKLKGNYLFMFVQIFWMVFSCTVK